MVPVLFITRTGHGGCQARLEVVGQPVGAPAQPGRLAADALVAVGRAAQPDPAKFADIRYANISLGTHPAASPAEAAELLADYLVELAGALRSSQGMQWEHFEPRRKTAAHPA